MNTRSECSQVGICGEHGGDPESIRFFMEAGLDYVSCSALRVPVARLAVAQAAIGIQERLLRECYEQQCLAAATLSVTNLPLAVEIAFEI